jgi:SAM-dependent methyltransferase
MTRTRGLRSGPAPAHPEVVARCPVCRSDQATELFPVRAVATENGVDPHAFRPSSERFGRTLGRVLRCRACGHGYLEHTPASAAVSEAYGQAVDETSLREEAGQVETARRCLRWIESVTAPGRLVDFGCWTGSFLVAARERGWQATGVEPSRWAVERARSRGLDVRLGSLEDPGLDEVQVDAVVACDVLEHLEDPARGLARMAAVLSPTGVLFLTLPDAGSAVARLLGSRWWSVLPMHLQYFTRESVSTLLRGAGFSVIGIRSHPKVFSLLYYAERLGGYSGTVGELAVRCVDRPRWRDRLVAPDFRDRMQVLAQRRPGPTGRITTV